MLKYLAMICLSVSLSAYEYVSLDKEQEWDCLDYIDFYIHNSMDDNERQMWIQEIMHDFEERDKYNAYELYSVKKPE